MLEVPKAMELVQSKWSIFSTAILTTSIDNILRTKLDHYYDLHVYPGPDKNMLHWWEVYAVKFSIHAGMAKDILAASRVSAPFKQLFQIHCGLIA